MSSATAAGVGAAVALGVGSAVGVGDGVPVGDGAGVGVGVGSGVAVAVGAGVEVLVAVGGGAAAGVAAASGLGVGARVGVAVGTGTGVSARATVAVGCGSAAALTPVAGADTAVVPAGTGVSATGAVCSPPQPARAITAARHSSSTAEAIPVPVGLPHTDFMAPFSAPGAVGSMTRPVYPPGVPPVRLRRCRWLAVRRESAGSKKHPPGGEGLSHNPADGGLLPLIVVFLPSVVNGWQRGSVLSPGVTSGGQKTGCPNFRCVWRSSQEPNFAADHHRAKLPPFRHASSCPWFDHGALTGASLLHGLLVPPLGVLQLTPVVVGQLLKVLHPFSQNRQFNRL